jgi:hypothetical protein
MSKIMQNYILLNGQRGKEVLSDMQQEMDRLFEGKDAPWWQPVDEDKDYIKKADEAEELF